MSLAKLSYLYRVRIMFEVDGTPTLVETVHKDAVTEHGEVLSETERVQKYTSAKMSAAVANLLKEIERVGAEDAVEEAARKQAAAEAKAAAAAEAARAAAEKAKAEAAKA